MKKTSHEDPLLAASVYAAIGPVAVVGNIARTWYIDHDQIRHVLEALEALAGGPFEVCHAQQVPFDDHVEAAAVALELPIARCWAPALRADRLCSRYERPVAMLDRAALLVAFPKEHEPFSSADPCVVLCALNEGIPVLAVRRDTMEFYSPRE